MKLNTSRIAASGIASVRSALQPLRPGGALETSLLLLLAGCVSVGQGQDRNWDLLNYHLYNAFSFLNGRLASDLFPVGVQSYFNPLLDLPYYLLSVQLMPGLPRGVAFLAGIPFGLLIVVVLRIARIALPPVSLAEAWLAPIATAIGVSGGMTWSEIGTTFGDIPVAVLVLFGLLIPLSLLPRRGTVRSRAWGCAMFLAGILIGCAAGLKLTACIFAPGALIGLSLTAGGTRRAWIGAFAFCLGWGGGFALAYSWWGYALYWRFGSPFFPLYNHIFGSPWVPAENFQDNRFMPRSSLQALFYPFFWLRGRSFIVAEVDVRDPRFALAYIAIAGLTIGAVVNRWRGRQIALGVIPRPIVAALCIFMGVSYIVWEATSSILRYAIGLEAITGIIIVLGVRAATALRPWPRLSMERLGVVCAILLIAIVAVSSRPGWGRLKQYGVAVFDFHAPSIPDHATIILADKPIGFAAPFLRGRDIAFIGIGVPPGPGRLFDSIQHRLHGAPPTLVLINNLPASYVTTLGTLGIIIDPATCQRIVNDFVSGLTLCGARATDGA